MINTLNGKNKAIIIFLFFMVLSIGMIVSSLESHNQYVYAEDNYTEIPVVTIITHGLGGSPVDWSNDGVHFDDTNGGLNSSELLIVETKYNNSYTDYNFKISDSSLIEQLRKKYPNSVVYVVSANNDPEENSGHPCIDVFTPDLSSPTGYSAASTTTLNITMHSIIVYNALNTGKDFVSYGGCGQQ